MSESANTQAPGSETGNTMPPVSPSAAPVPSDSPSVNAESQQPFGPTTGIGSPVPVPQKQAEWESGYQNEHGPRPSRWEQWVSEPFQEGAHSTIASPWGGALLRMGQDALNKTGKVLSADDANKLFPGRPVPYTTPIDMGVASMEFEDRKKQQDMADWAAQRPQTFMGRVVGTASGFVGGLTDPLNFAVGMASGGVSELLAPEATGLAGKVAAHYLANLAGFSVADATQNLIEHQMGAKQKQLTQVIGENAVPAAVMTGVGLGLGALARRYLNEGGGTSEADLAGIKKTVAELEQDRRPPTLDEQRAVLASRRSGVSTPSGPDGPKTPPTVMTSPLQASRLYAAAHADGAPLVHEHGLGPGIQLTDSREVANNGVSRSSETPGQVAPTQLPAQTKLLDIDQSAAQAPDFVKALEEKTGLQIDPEQPLKDLITSLGDWAGAEYGKVSVPEDILKQAQEIAKSQGFAGYEFASENSRQVHLFDPSGLQAGEATPANPDTTPALPEAGPSAQEPNPALDKTQSKFYSPEIEQLVHEFRKGEVFDPYSPEAVADAEKDIEQYKQQLKDLSETSASAKESLDSLRKQEAQDKRLADIAKRISECGQGGGL